MKRSRFQELVEHNQKASPLYAAFYLHLRELLNNQQPTMYTDGKIVGYNQEFIDKLSLAEGDTALCHEVLHVIFKHPMNGEKLKKWMVSQGMEECWPCINIAGDQIINANLKAEGKVVLPKWCWEFEDDAAAKRSIYEQIPRVYKKRHHEHQQQGCGCPQNAPGSSQGDQEDEGGGQSPPKKGQGQKGSGSGGSCKKHGPGCCNPMEGMSQAEMQEYEQKINEAIVRAAKIAKSRGTAPAWAERYVEEITVPKVPYKQHLKEWFDSKIPSDFSWNKPSRMGMSQGLYLPRFEVESLGEIAVMVDVSGSVDAALLSRFCANLKDIFFTCHPSKVHVIYVDAEVQKHEEFSRYDELKLTPVGGGGTSFRPGFEYLKRKGIEVRGVVYLTDLYGDWKEMDDPGIPTLFVTPSKEEAVKQYVGSWGRVLYIPDGE